jgi:hypothetical protein
VTIPARVGRYPRAYSAAAGFNPSLPARKEETKKRPTIKIDRWKCAVYIYQTIYLYATTRLKELQ